MPMMCVIIFLISPPLSEHPICLLRTWQGTRWLYHAGSCHPHGSTMLLLCKLTSMLQIGKLRLGEVRDMP